MIKRVALLLYPRQSLPRVLTHSLFGHNGHVRTKKAGSDTFCSMTDTITVRLLLYYNSVIDYLTSILWIQIWVSFSVEWYPASNKNNERTPFVLALVVVIGPFVALFPLSMFVRTDGRPNTSSVVDVLLYVCPLAFTGSTG